MERDVRATERPVTQRFCTINTSCSRGGGGSSQSSHTRARARARSTAPRAQTARPLESGANSRPRTGLQARHSIKGSGAVNPAECIRVSHVKSASHSLLFSRLSLRSVTCVPEVKFSKVEPVSTCKLSCVSF